MQATQKQHSTVGEAHAAAQEMGAYSAVLTHFSQRYGKWLPEAEAESAYVQKRCTMAFDGMRVPLALLPWLPLIMPAVHVACSEDDWDPATASS